MGNIHMVKFVGRLLTIVVFALVGFYVLANLIWFGQAALEIWQHKSDYDRTFPMSMCAINSTDRDIFIIDFVGSTMLSKRKSYEEEQFLCKFWPRKTANNES